MSAYFCKKSVFFGNSSTYTQSNIMRVVLFFVSVFIFCKIKDAKYFLPNIWRLGQVRGTKFGKDVSNKMLLNAAKYQGYSFYYFWFIKGKPTGG